MKLCRAEATHHAVENASVTATTMTHQFIVSSCVVAPSIPTTTTGRDAGKKRMTVEKESHRAARAWMGMDHAPREKAGDGMKVDAR